ncbi:MAG TPA: HPr(Ser) kinase/phosphatase [Spirochaetales bacterium]|nr:HPr(Ser) kinase/phosphatase [Spirochaetales bacterium]HPD80977.1 HPr(Ser) kinase/phosphatase [Spirochaetales bacterium]HQG40100.1 HPr(Ser) kinase/phosphatase [Spirochaetales bacterium]HQK34530.1 HPr(Ser) kinase/phosphatase [Spirochaetales bacterium]HRV29425.1 HPr(Ser) kinase/phosphatase [Spirochaetia bacterium]
MGTSSFTVLNLLSMEFSQADDLKLRCVGGRKGLSKTIETPDLNRPGLALAGFYEDFAWNRIQIIGNGEFAYLTMLTKENRLNELQKLFEFEIPCFIFTYNHVPDQTFIKMAEQVHCPILITELSSPDFVSRVSRVLATVFAPKTTIHGVLMEVYGIGILITGDSGVGKSETALELIERGHRLVADDVVEIRSVSGNYLMGSGANKVIGHHMEIRGLGIINITHLFGVRAIRDKKQVQLICNLEEWNAEKVYDRLGVDEESIEILGIKIPKLDIPVKPGRNIPIIIETAAMNERLKKMGYNSAQEFNKNILRWLESESARAVYFNDQE